MNKTAFYSILTVTLAAVISILFVLKTTAFPYSRDSTFRLNLIKRVEIPNGARPEIIVAEERVFVVYLEPSTFSFRVKIFDEGLNSEINSKTLAARSPEYGHPTDIRVVSDGKYLYAFYETAKDEKGTTYLFGAKYKLDDDFERVAYNGPIAKSTLFKIAQPGDEKLDDPAPMIQGENVYVMTRYKTSLTKEGRTRYKLRKFDKNLNQQSEFELDLSKYADGEGRQASILFDNGYYYIVLPTTTGDSGNIVETVAWTVPSDILMVKLGKKWNVKQAKIIASQPGYTEGYVTGFKSDDKYFYVTYNQVILGREFSSVIRIYDKNWNNVLTEKYKSADLVRRGIGLRPSIELTQDRIYAGNSEFAAHGAEIYIFGKDK